MLCLESVLEVNTDATSSAVLFSALPAGECFGSAFPGVSVQLVGNLLSLSSLVALRGTQPTWEPLLSSLQLGK